MQSPTPSRVPDRYGNTQLYDQIHEDALLILEQYGIRASEQVAQKITDALDPGEAGRLIFSSEAGRFFINRDDIAVCLDRVRQGMGYWPAGFGTGGMAAYVTDSHGPRTARLPDMSRLARIFSQTDEITSFQASFNVCAHIRKTEVAKQAEMECAIIDEMVAHGGGKLVSPTILTNRGIRHLGECYQNGQPVGAALSIISTFLCIGDSMLDPFLETVRNRIPYIMNSMPIGGLTGPYSLSSLATLAHAEAMFGLILGQLVSPGIRAVHAAMPTIADVGSKDMPLRFGSRANTLLNILIAELNRHLGLPGCQSACGHSRSSFDKEAEAELVKTFSLVRRYRFHILRHLFGFAAQLNDFSIDDMERQIGLFRENERNPAPVETPPAPEYDPDGLEAIFEGMDRQDFRGIDHTLKHIGRSFGD